MRTRGYKLLLMGILVIPLTGTGVWKALKDLPGPERVAAVSFVIDGKGYVFGGCKGEKDYNDLWQYDPATSAWKKCASLPGAGMREPVAYVFGQKAYVGLGISQKVQTSRIWCYDAATDTWSESEPYYQDQRAARACTVDSYAYVFGGFCFGERSNLELYALDFRTMEWEARESLPASADPRSYPVWQPCNGKIYMMGGLTKTREYLNDFWQYDPDTDEWKRLPEFIGAGRTTASSFAINGKVYVGLGKDAETYFKDWYCYDPKTEEWAEVTEYPEVTTYGNAYFSIGNKGYISTGSFGKEKFSKKLYEFGAQ